MQQSLLKKFLLVLNGFAASSAIAALPTVPDSPPVTVGPPSNQFWLMSAGVDWLNLHSETENNIKGVAASLGFGYSYFVSEKLLVSGVAETLQGPWSRIRNQSFEADFFGSGFTGDFIYSPFGDPIRSGKYSWASGISLSYGDRSGRSIGQNRKAYGDPDSASNLFLEQNYKINTSGMTLSPAIVWMKFKEPRPSGNTAELLTTRNEGAALRLGIKVPIYIKYRAVITKRDDAAGSNQEVREFVEKGTLKGISIFAMLQFWLGS